MGAERRGAAVSLEEALTRLAEFLSVQLGAGESGGTAPDLGQPGELPPLLTVTSQLLALLAWIRSPRARRAFLQRTQPASRVQPPPPDGPLPAQEDPSDLAAGPGEAAKGEAPGQQPLQLEEDQRAWQRLEQLILGQGATDSEKRVQHLTLENEALKQSLSLTRDLLRHWGAGPPARAPQDEAEALGELQGRLQEAQHTTEALRVQVGVGLGARGCGGVSEAGPGRSLLPQ